MNKKLFCLMFCFMMVVSKNSMCMERGNRFLVPVGESKYIFVDFRMMGPDRGELAKPGEANFFTINFLERDVTKAIRADDIDKLESIITKEKLVISEPIEGTNSTLLSLAAQHSKEKTLRWILKQPSSRVNYQNKYGITALFHARNLASAKILLENGADPNISSSIGLTAFSSVVSLEKVGTDVIEIMLQHGANPNVKRNGMSLLDFLIQWEKVKYLCSKVLPLLRNGVLVTDKTIAIAQKRLDFPMDVLAYLKEYQVRTCEICLQSYSPACFKSADYSWCCYCLD
jgi:hypothetical protein